MGDEAELFLAKMVPEYCVVRRLVPGINEDIYEIQRADREPTEDNPQTATGLSLGQLKANLEAMLRALDRPVVDARECELTKLRRENGRLNKVISTMTAACGAVRALDRGY